MRKVVPLLVGGIAGAVVLLWAFVLRKEADSEGGRTLGSIEGAAFQPASKEALHKLARDLSASRPGVSAQEIRNLVREAAAAYRAKDAALFRKTFVQITRHGSSIQRLLAELITDLADPDEQWIAAKALGEVATKEIVPFAIALARSGLSDLVLGVAVELLTKFEVADAAPTLEALLFQPRRSNDLRRLLLAYFVKGKNLRVLARAAVEPDFERSVRVAAANGLAEIGTREAADLLLAAWKAHFHPKKASRYGYLLAALARFKPEILRAVAKEFLAAEADPSRKNVFYAWMARGDRGFALELLTEALKSETMVPVRVQLIAALGQLGGAEAQGILLGFLSSPDSKLALAGMNALLRQKTMDLPFADTRKVFESMKEPWLRAALGTVLAKYEIELKSDPEFAKKLVGEAKDGIKSPDLGLRGLSIGMYAGLAKYTDDPAGNLHALYGSLSKKEQAQYPQVFVEIAKQKDDPKSQAIVQGVLGDESAPSTSRCYAADTLFVNGKSEAVYQAIAGAKSPEIAAVFTGIALVRGGKKAAGRLTEIAGATNDPKKKAAIGKQVELWSKGVR